MNWNNRREKFRQQLARNQCIHPGSVFDPVSARMAESLGFEAGMFAGSVASLTVLGDPDLIVLTLSEFAEQAYRINRACNLPLLVDADHGYGNALNVKRTVEELETAGVSALSIEDTDLPWPFGTEGKSRLISVEEGVGKMKAAVAGRQDSSLVIAARTSAVSINGVDDAIERIRAYQETGVDAIFLIGIKQAEQLDQVAEVCRLPLILGGASHDMMDLTSLADRGVRISLQGHQPIMAGMQAVYKTLKALRQGSAPADLDGVPDSRFIDEFTRAEDFKKWSKLFLD
ncbi:MAG: isocitrate lyase/phosphoenolpyruvate mutase family protein [Arenicellales bacterium]